MDTSELTSKGIRGLPKNMYVEHLQELQDFPALHLTCDLCVSQDVAVKRCEKCDCNLCEFCMQAHQKQRKTSLHKLVDVGKQGPIHWQQVGGVGGMHKITASERRKVLCCDTHGEEELELFCKNCNVPMCHKCASEDHHNHSFLPLEDARAQYSDVLQGLVTQAKPLATSLTESIRNIEFVLFSVQQRSEAVSEEIIEFVSSHMKALQEHKRSLLLQLDAIKKQKENTLKIQMAHLKGVLAELTSSYDVATRAIDEGLPSLAFDSRSPAASKLEELVSAKQETSPKEDDYIHFHRRVPADDKDGFHMFGVLDSRGPSAANTAAEGEGLYTAREGKTSQFKVVVNDRYKQRRDLGGDKLEASMTGSKGEVVHMFVDDSEDGSYVVSYTPNSTGEHRLSVLVEGKHVRGSPFVVNVRRRNSRHHGLFHCCTFCSSEGKKHMRCGCGGVMPGGYSGCGHGHPGHPGCRHWSCCGSTEEVSDCLL